MRKKHNIFLDTDSQGHNKNPVINLLLNFEAEIRLGYKALILALWFCGTFVYLRQGVVFYDYFNLIEVAVVIFILVLSFRTDRLVRRTTNEENNTIELQQKINNGGFCCAPGYHCISEGKFSYQ